MAFDLTDLPTAARTAFVGRLAAALASGAFASRRMWRHAIVFDVDEGRRAMSRADFIGWATANDLPALAREVTARQVPLGHVLVFLQRDRADVATSSIFLVDLAGELARIRRGHGA